VPDVPQPATRPEPPFHNVWIELDVPVGSDDAFVEVAMDWLDGGSRRYLGPARQRLDDDVNPPWKNAPDVPWGPPNAVWGTVRTVRNDSGRLKFAQRQASRKGWRWLEEQLRSLPWKAESDVIVLDEGGFATDELIRLEAGSEQHSPGFIRLCSRLNVRAFTEAAAGKRTQQRWLDLLFDYANRHDPSYGQIGVEHMLGATTLEVQLPPNYGRNLPMYTVGESHQILRGYAWLTIVPRELAERLGGAPALESSGAFADVRRLAAGGVWLLATRNYGDYGLDEALKVFAALAPILRPGLPRQPQPQEHGPFFLAFEDAALGPAEPPLGPVS
jgi:hypothetical protein